jgi:hypothetical protein
MHHVSVAAIAVCGGFLGSTIHEWAKSSPTTIRARRFEVLSPAGATLSYWGPDNNPTIPAATPTGALLVFIDTNGIRRCQVGSRPGDFGPELVFYGKDGPSETRPSVYRSQERFSIALGSFEDPILSMHGHGLQRVSLGAIHGDAQPDPTEDQWGLSLRAGAVREGEPRPGADIGFFRRWDGSYHSLVTLNDGTGADWQAVAGRELKPIPLLKGPKSARTR